MLGTGETMRRSPTGVGLEAIAFAVTLGIAVALTQDARATGLHVASVWVATASAIVPLALAANHHRRPILIDEAVAVVLVLTIAGSYTIGGLALLIAAFLLLIAGILHHLATVEGLQAWHADAHRPHLLGGWIFAALGACFGLSMSLLVVLGWILSLVALGLLGTALSERRRAQGQRPWLGGACAVGIVLSMNAMAWGVVIAGTAVF